MSINLQQVINDARNLTNRLIEDENKCDSLLKIAKCTQVELEHIKKYSEDVDVLNAAASQRSQSGILSDLQKETQQMRELQAENRELRTALDEYQNALELIMSKYRQQMDLMTRESHSQELPFDRDAYSQIILEQCDQISDMKSVMRRAIAADEEEMIREKEVITQLTIENKGLREMFSIYQRYGQQQPDPDIVADEGPVTPAASSENIVEHEEPSSQP